MGPFPKKKMKPSLDMKVIERADTSKIFRWKISYASEQGDRTTGYLLRPKKLKGRVPGILCLHQTTPLGAQYNPSRSGALINLGIYAHNPWPGG